MAQFPVTSASQVLLVAGSVFIQVANTTIGIEINVDDSRLGAAEIRANANARHMAVVPQYLALNLEPGTHTLVLAVQPGTPTQSDEYDFYRAIVIE